jgi:hypothetical protein
MNSDRDTLAGGLPHSEIPGSPIARISPGLFAACHVLHRLSVPRHPPDALASRLITTSPSPATLHHRRAQGQAPCRVPATAESGGLYEDTSLGQARRRLGLRRPGWQSFASPKGARRCRHPTCPPRSHHNSLFTRQSTSRRGRPRRCRAIFSERRRATLPSCRSHLRVPPPGCGRSLALPVVEVNGFEPMTSCLQSRRSPS